MQNKISIIIPVYNVEPYFRACLDSLLAQSFCEWEAILVNDGSTDNSGRIADEYAKKDPRIKVFHKENGGVNTARNLGLTKATGEYLTFLDADDFFPHNALEKLYNKTINENLDIVIGQQYKVFAGTPFNLENIDKLKAHLEHKYTQIFSWRDLDFKHKYQLIWFMVVGSKLYKRALWTGVDFPQNIKMGEDQVVIKEIMLKANKISVISDYVYVYFLRKGSATTKRSLNALHIFESYNIMLELFKKYNVIDAEYTNLHKFFFDAFLMHMRRFLPFGEWLNFLKTMKENLQNWNLNKFDLEQIGTVKFNAIKSLKNASNNYLRFIIIEEFIKLIIYNSARAIFNLLNRIIPRGIKKKLHKLINAMIAALTKISDHLI